MCSTVVQEYFLSHLSFNYIEHRGEAHASLLRHHEAVTSDSISVAVGRHGHTDELGTDLLPANRKCLITEDEHVVLQGGASYLRYSGVHLARAGQWLKAFLMMQGLFGPIQSL